MLVSGKVVEKLVDKLRINCGLLEEVVKKVIQYLYGLLMKVHKLEVLQKSVGKLSVKKILNYHFRRRGFPDFTQTTTNTTIYIENKKTNNNQVLFTNQRSLIDIIFNRNEFYMNGLNLIKEEYEY